jgi:hypothetical protein
MNIKSNSVKFFAVVAFVFGLTVSTANAAYSFPNMIDTAQERMDVQTVLNMVVTPTPNLVVDGKIGAKSIAAVKAFQAMKNLVVDGKIGPMTRAALEAAQSSTTGGSTTTAGCTAGAMYSSTTGLPCSTGTTSVLTGGAGDITVSNLSSVSNEKVGEGDVDHKVFAFEVEADNGSDIALNSVKLTLEQTNSSGSDKLTRYATNVSVWMGSTKVGSATAASFSESAGVYSKSISLAGAVIKADQKASFYVSVDGAANIDSTDLSNNTWDATLESVRFSDATGAILTETPATDLISKNFEFATLASAGDVELKVNLSSSNPVAKTVKVSTTSSTNQVELLKFTMKAQGSSMTIDQVPVSLTTTGTLSEVTSNVTLKIAGNTYNETVSNVASTAVILFDDLNLSVSKDATVEAVVYADINDIESPLLTEGTTLSAAITSDLVDNVSGNYIDVEDMNGDQLATGDRTGSANGETMTFRSTGVNTVMGTPTYSNTTDTNGLVTSVTYTIPVAVTSFGNTLYVGQSAELATAASASNAFALVVETAALPTTESVSATTSITLSSSNATVETNGYRLDDGVTKNFTINVTMTRGTDNTSHRFRLDTIRTFTEGGLISANATNSNLLPTTNYRTDFRYINN